MAVAGSVPVSAGPGDRLTFTLFVAAALHAALVLGVTFAPEEAAPPTRTLEVTLATHRDDTAPKDADFIAQHDQHGSGTLATAAELTTDHESPFHAPQIAAVERTPAAPAVPAQPAGQDRTVVAAERPAAQAAAREVAQVARPRQPLRLDYQSRPSPAFATLEARLAGEQQSLAHQPRIRRLTSVSARSATDAYYLNAWRRKVETLGNLNYPEEARRRRLYGSLRMLVVLRPDGELKDVQILESSGHAVLDDAALRIVRLAAPFAPFPEEMRATTDELEIIRTWEFRQNGYSSRS